jgi:anaerobic dimethyl sulfoxide reductase subunit B
MAPRYAFLFDQAACSGCKACQAACKDRHGLLLGVLWRRVYEIAGGAWSREREAWQPDVFAFNLSLACNHCAQPICVEVCPTGAIYQRDDGLVLLDGAKCVGCRYCAWACPYGAPQYDERAGRMTKCSFCAEDLDAGLPPACVRACPMRALEFGEREALEAAHRPSPAAFPLPDPALTEPGLVIIPHRDARRARPRAATVANAEEVGR